MRDEQAKELIEHIREIRLALEGNTKLGIEGMVRMVKRHDDWITNMNLRIAMWSGIGAVVVLIGRWAITRFL